MGDKESDPADRIDAGAQRVGNAAPPPAFPHAAVAEIAKMADVEYLEVRLDGDRYVVTVRVRMTRA